MYQRALQGYDKALGLESILHNLPALNIAYNLGHLHSNLGERDKAKLMDSRAQVRYETVFGNDHERCKDVGARLCDLATHTKKEGTQLEKTQILSKNWD